MKKIKYTGILFLLASVMVPPTYAMTVDEQGTVTMEYTVRRAKPTENHADIYEEKTVTYRLSAEEILEHTKEQARQTLAEKIVAKHNAHSQLQEAERALDDTNVQAALYCKAIPTLQVLRNLQAQTKTSSLSLIKQLVSWEKTGKLETGKKQEAWYWDEGVSNSDVQNLAEKLHGFWQKGELKLPKKGTDDWGKLSQVYSGNNLFCSLAPLLDPSAVEAVKQQQQQAYLLAKEAAAKATRDLEEAQKHLLQLTKKEQTILPTVSPTPKKKTWVKKIMGLLH